MGVGGDKLAIFRINKTEDFTIMSNRHFKEKEMSLKAKGLLSQMLSLPDDWDYSIAGLSAINKESVGVIRNTLDELKDFGYLIVTKKMPNETDSGRIEYVYDVFEKPQRQEKQGTEKQGIEKQYVVSQYVENDTQLNTNKLKTKKSNTNIFNIYNDEFEKLWKIYPKKQGKAKAHYSFVKARQKGTTFEEIESGLKRYIAYVDKSKIKSQYIKQGSTWFNQQCWQDEYEEHVSYKKQSESSFDIDELDIIR